MSKNRKTAELREKDLRFALLRIKRGRSNSGSTRVSIAAVAREAGITPALIHNHYPAIADAIRLEQGRAGRAQRNAKDEKLKQERENGRELRREIAALRADTQRLSSINEVLLAENEVLRARLSNENVVQLKQAQPFDEASIAAGS